LWRIENRDGGSLNSPSQCLIAFAVLGRYPPSVKMPKGRPI
jgi:hypothetical protein